MRSPSPVTPSQLKQAAMDAALGIGLDERGTDELVGLMRRMEKRNPNAYYNILEKLIPTTKADEPSLPMHYEVGLLPPEQWERIHLQMIAEIMDTSVFALVARWDALTHTSTGSVGTVSEKTFRQITAP